MTDSSLNAPVTKPVGTVQSLTKRDIWSTYFRGSFLMASWNYERMLALGFAVTMIPTIKRFYHKKDDQIAALKRHLEFFNTAPWACGPVFGVTSALEQKKAAAQAVEGAEQVPDSAIQNVKIGLMGPLAGIGDPIFWGTARPVLGALGASLALTGNILGPIIFFVGLNIIRFVCLWWGFKIGYGQGLELVSDLGGGRLRKLTKGAAVMGLFVMGALVSKWTTINFPLVISKYTDQTTHKVVETTLQQQLDSLLPGLAALGLTFLVMWLLRKHVNPVVIIIGLFVVGILAYWVGLIG